MNTGSHRLAWLSVLAAASALAACNRKEEAPAPAPAASAPAAAAPAAPPPAGPIIAPVQVAAPTEAQRTAGATLAAQGAGAAVACNTCHGAQGEGQAAANFPRLAGQSRSYLQHELESYADGSRKNPIMQPIAAALTPEQRVNVAVYFAALPPGAPAAAGAPAASSAKGGGGRGNQLASTGDEGKGVQACANCHGPGGIGSGELYPYLAGQHAGYLSATLAAWRDGTRNNDPSGQMPVIGKALAPEDVAALVAYYAGQPLRATPIGSERMAAPALAPASAVQSGPQTQVAGAGASTAPAAAAGGAGITQGAGVTGGAQGPGGGGGTGPSSTGNPAAGAAATGAAASAAAAPASGTR